MLTLSKNGKRGPVTANLDIFLPVFDLFWSQSPLVNSTWGLRWLLNYLKSFVKSLSNIFLLFTALVPPHIANSCQNCFNLYPKNVKNEELWSFCRLEDANLGQQKKGMIIKSSHSKILTIWGHPGTIISGPQTVIFRRFVASSFVSSFRRFVVSSFRCFGSGAACVF